MKEVPQKITMFSFSEALLISALANRRLHVKGPRKKVKSKIDFFK